MNGAIWSSGLGAAALFLWRVIYCDAEPTCIPPGVAALVARTLAILAVPIVLALTVAARAVRWVIE